MCGSHCRQFYHHMGEESCRPASGVSPQSGWWQNLVSWEGWALTHWGWVTHVCVSKPTIIGSDNGLWPGWSYLKFWTSAGILLIQTLGTNISEILNEIHKFSFKKMHFKMLSVKQRHFVSLNVLIGDSLPPQWVKNVVFILFRLLIKPSHRDSLTKRL